MTMIKPLIGAGHTDAANTDRRPKPPLACDCSLVEHKPFYPEFRLLGCPNGCTPMAFLRLSVASDALDSGLHGLDAQSTQGSAPTSVPRGVIRATAQDGPAYGVIQATIDEPGHLVRCGQHVLMAWRDSRPITLGEIMSKDMNPNEMTTAQIVAELLAENETPLSEQEYAMLYQAEQIETARSERYEELR